VTIAVAGLSRAGKTVFLTSLIANLQAAAKHPSAAKWLGGLKAVEDRRLHSVVEPPNYKPRYAKRLFSPQDALEALCAERPTWPARTADVYEVALDISFWPGKRPSAEEQADAALARLRIVLVDYPGEWLVDVPLLEQSYAAWSASVFRRLQREPWAGLSRDFNAFLGSHDWATPDDNGLAKKAAQEWQKVLRAARDHELKWLQPGQFVRERGLPNSDAVPELDKQDFWFCPLPADTINKARRGSIAHTMAQRYDAYQKTTALFFGAMLKGARYHLLLVDVIDALASGEAPFNETAEILEAVYRVFSSQHSGIWRLFNRGAFEKVVLLATKADTVPPNQRPALSKLLTDMCAGAVAGATGVPPPDARYVAAVRATTDFPYTPAGTAERVIAVKGYCADVGKERVLISLDIPEGIPDRAYFARRQGQRPPRFVPPTIEGRGKLGIPNLRLGEAMQALVGDLLT
jgi:predicted YcjX-like family ATPase